jgi:hypothetical protein
MADKISSAKSNKIIVWLLLIVTIPLAAVMMYNVWLDYKYSDYQPPWIVNELIVKANRGDNISAEKLYLHYLHKKDDDQALHWLRIFSKSGDAKSHYRLYSFLINLNKREFFSEAVENVRLSAKEGYPVAMWEYWHLYSSHRIADSNKEEAEKWLALAASAFYQPAMRDVIDVKLNKGDKASLIESYAWIKVSMAKEGTTPNIAKEIAARVNTVKMRAIAAGMSDSELETKANSIKNILAPTK